MMMTLVKVDANSTSDTSRSSSTTSTLALLELPALLVQLALLVLRALQVLLVLPALELLAPILPLVATGPAGGVRDQLEQKVKVVQAMHERTAICADVQTEHVLCRQSLGIGRVNHVLRVHGHELARREGRSRPSTR